jgi:hypothetical protein
MSQLVFLARDGKTLHLPFRAGRWTVERIKELLKDRGVSPDQIVAFANSEDENVEMRALTDHLVPNGKELEVSPLADGVEIEGEMKAQMTEKYVRAIAKIGFHSFLKFFPQFSGFEAEFDEIKRFIYKGEANRQMVERTEACRRRRSRRRRNSVFSRLYAQQDCRTGDLPHARPPEAKW